MGLVAMFVIAGTVESGPPVKHSSRPPPVPDKPGMHTHRSSNVSHVQMPYQPCETHTSTACGPSLDTSARSDSGRKSNTEVALHTIETQLEALQADPTSDPIAIEMIQRLQSQLQELQETVFVHSELPVPVHTSPPGGGQESLIKAALQGNMRPRRRRQSDDARSDSGSEKSDDYPGELKLSVHAQKTS